MPSKRDDASVTSANNFAVSKERKSARNGKNHAQQSKHGYQNYKSSNNPITWNRAYKKHDDACDSETKGGYAAKARDRDNPLDC